MLRKIPVFAILIALVLASFPTFGISAKGVINTQLERKWDQSVTNFNNQNFNHGRIHKLVDNRLSTNNIARASEKAKVQKHLSIYSSAIESAAVIVANHAGYDRDGKVIDRDLAYCLQMHAG